jgi:hypothetical protein
MPDTTKLFILETDASEWAIGATLLQKQEDGQLHPCGYLSHALTQTERNWQIYDRELYAIIYALDEWKYSDSNNCPNVLYFLIVHNIASHSDQTEPKCWCM